MNTQPKRPLAENFVVNPVWHECPPDRNDRRPYWFWDGASTEPELITYQMRENTTRSGLWVSLSTPAAPNATLIVSPDTYWRVMVISGV